MKIEFVRQCECFQRFSNLPEFLGHSVRETFKKRIKKLISEGILNIKASFLDENWQPFFGNPPLPPQRKNFW